MEIYSELYQEEYETKATFLELYSRLIIIRHFLEEEDNKNIPADEKKVAELEVDANNLAENLEAINLDREEREDLKEKNKILGRVHKDETNIAATTQKLQRNLKVQLSELQNEFETSEVGQEHVVRRTQSSQTDSQIFTLMQENSELENQVNTIQNDTGSCDEKCHREGHKLEQEIQLKEITMKSLVKEMNSTDDTLVNLQKECHNKMVQLMERKIGTSIQSKDESYSLMGFSNPNTISKGLEIKKKDYVLSELFTKTPITETKDTKGKRKSYPEIKKPGEAVQGSTKAVSEPQKPPKRQKNESARKIVQEEPVKDVKADKMEVDLNEMRSASKTSAQVPSNQQKTVAKEEKKKAEEKKCPRKRLTFADFTELAESKKGEAKKMKSEKKFSQEAVASSQEKKNVSQAEVKNASKEKVKATEKQQVQEKQKPSEKPKPETKAQKKMNFMEMEESKKISEAKRVKVLENIVIKPAVNTPAKSPPSPSGSSFKEFSELNSIMDMGDLGDFGTDACSGDFNIESDNGDFNFQDASSDNAEKNNFGW
ncbi:uncharacterized protein LOC129799188 [Phlebotomus papatasi]|uniref:uncharacterized protein LOC129799188 n=1 Tax=Phlebotomus papatasi TaxID=29031 RepID=UPI0024842970|nr:uncharacterized protein LOC129799188 [Phlebotomus papatasi]